MLVITRKKGEALVIDENIHITIENIQKNQVKISIDAPKNVTIVRKEIIQQITQENKAAIVQKDNLQTLNIMAEKIKRRGNK